MKTTSVHICVAILLPFFVTLNHHKLNNSIVQPTPTFAEKEKCSEGGFAYASIASKEELNQNGSFTFALTLTAQDTLWIDSITTGGSSYFSLTIGGNGGNSFAPSPAFSQLYLLPGLQTTTTIAASYNASQLPYYPKDISLRVWVHNAKNWVDAASTEVKVYFTPYGTTEIWDIADFVQLPRVWATPRIPEPARVSIAKSLIPLSTRPDLSTITEAWQTNFQESFVAGLPYSILMEAIHPDTIKAWETADSLNAIAGNNAIGGRTFTGTLTGRLSSNIINDNGVPTTIYPAGVEVRLLEEDLWRQEFGKTHTDANGYFSISYDKWQSYVEGSNIELYLEIYSRNSQYDLEVVENGVVNSTFNTNYKQHYWLGSKGTSYTENIDWQYVSDPFKVLHWTYKAFEFSTMELGNGTVSNNLRIKLYQNGSDFSSLFGSKIRLENGDEKHESVIWHEFGHFAMYRLQNGYDAPCSYGNHSSSGEAQNHNLAWSEGWATGWMAMVDKFYQSMDGEYGWYASSEGIRSYNLEQRLRTKFSGNGLRNEYVISCAIYDLYDGPDRFPANTAASNYNDIASVSSPNNNANIGYEPNVYDDLQLTVAQICQPLRNGGNPQSVADYFYTLIYYADCSNWGKISKVFSQNAVRPNTADYNTSLSGDRIGISGNLVTYGCLLNATMLKTFYTMDKNILNGLSESWNFGAFTQYASDKIVEDLTVKNGAVLGVNNNSKDGFNGAYPSNNTNMYLDACGNTITIDNGSSVEIGGSNKGGALSIKNGAILVLKRGSILKIGWGSKLILAGGSLVFEDGAQINIEQEGTIEIQNGGQIMLRNNAKFKWTGLGYLKVNTATVQVVPNILASAPNINAIFEQRGIYTNGGWNQKLIEVTSGSLNVDKSLTLFSLISGQVKMGPSAILDVAAPMYLAAIKMDALTPVKYGGIWVYGQQNTPYLSKCAIDNAEIGLRIFSNKGSANKASVQYTNFNNCTIGVLSYGKSVEIKGGTFWGNLTGVFLSGNENTSLISGVNARGNRSAIDVIGTGTDLLDVKGVDVYSNSAVGAFMINSKIRPMCSRFENNYSNSRPMDGSNILLREYAYLDVEPYGTKDGGRNTIRSDYSHSIICMGASGLALNKGESDFSTPSSSGMSFFGTLDSWPFTTPRPTVLANENIWNTSGTAPLNRTDYEVTYRMGGITQSLDIDGSNPKTSPISLTNCNVSATDWGDWGDWDSDDKPSSLIGGGCGGTLIGQTPIDIVVKAGLVKVYDRNPNYVGAISDFTSAILVPYASHPNRWQIDMCINYTEFAYREAMTALGKAVSEGTVAATGSISTPVQLILNAQNVLKRYYQQFNASSKFFQVSLDEALVYRLINNRYQALEKIGELRNIATTDVENDLVNYYNCLISNEIVIETSNDKMDYLSIGDCRQLLGITDDTFEPIGERPADPIWQEVMDKRGAEETIEDNNKASLAKVATEETNDLTINISVYPNPASDFVNVKLPFGVEASEIRMLDITGRLVHSYQKEHAIGIIGLEVQLSNGTYFVEIVNGTQTIARRKIMIAK